jgi:hypothetical protein
VPIRITPALKYLRMSAFNGQHHLSDTHPAGSRELRE